MRFLAFLLNLPWTLIGLLVGVIDVPTKVGIHSRPFAIVLHVKSFWWSRLLPGHRGVRAITNGQVVQLGPTALPGDFEHELVHVEQHLRAPFIHPVMYDWQIIRYGYRQNKYEQEAYLRSGSRYLPK